jgi:hypothetical protein
LRIRCRLWLLGLCLVLLVGCNRQAADSTTGPDATPQSEKWDAIFPVDNDVAGWKSAAPLEVYWQDNLFDLVDGGADSYLAYGFEQVAVRLYQNAADDRLTLQVWKTASPADAYGLFTVNQSGAAVAVGNAGASEPGVRLVFWQANYFVVINAAVSLPDDVLQSFAALLSGQLPGGGEPPALVKCLPAGGLVENGYRFFHVELSIQDEVWLGGENALGLSPQTNGVLARYELEGGPARLMLVEYPDAAGAAAALNALRQIEDSELIVAETQSNLLGAVFGQADQAAAQALLEEGLQPQ